MDPDGSNQRRLTFSEGSDSEPVWSPDSSRIAFLSYRDHTVCPEAAWGCPQIYIMNADGTDQQRLTDDPNSKSLAAWLP
jgi:Tol biopolymer transport system component